jgi:carbamoyl-phosphate synthase small subunit
MKLFLEDGSSYEGKAFGAPVNMSGEVVFNTGMVGYVESLTDPSYAGQIVVLTYPLVGNYGVPSAGHFESKKIQIAGLVVSEYSDNYSHETAKGSLGEWLKRSNIPAITGVDTRALTKKLRERGVMLGALSTGGKPKKFSDPNDENLVGQVSPREVQVHTGGKIRIVLVDCGAKENIARSLVSRGATVLRVPWDYDFTKEDYDGLVLSNGPGDPTQCTKTIEHIRMALKQNKPILGICLGNQLLALAAGAKTYKLKYGHRSHNQPCIESETKRCYITSQNHGFAVDTKTLPRDWEPWFTNANDGSNEGLRHKTKPFRSVQFHPEATPGPTDTAWIFDEFLNSL